MVSILWPTTIRQINICNYIFWGIYIWVVEIWNNGIYKNEITSLNKQLENMSISNVTTINIYESWHENGAIFYKQKMQADTEDFFFGDKDKKCFHVL